MRNTGVNPRRKHLIKSFLCEEGNPSVTPHSSLAGFGKHPSCPGNDCSEQLYSCTRKSAQGLRNVCARVRFGVFSEGGWATCPDVVLAPSHFLLQLQTVAPGTELL